MITPPSFHAAADESWVIRKAQQKAEKHAYPIIAWEIDAELVTKSGQRIKAKYAIDEHGSLMDHPHYSNKEDIISLDSEVRAITANPAGGTFTQSNNPKAPTLTWKGRKVAEAHSIVNKQGAKVDPRGPSRPMPTDIPDRVKRLLGNDYNKIKEARDVLRAEGEQGFVAWLASKYDISGLHNMAAGTITPADIRRVFKNISREDQSFMAQMLRQNGQSEFLRWVKENYGSSVVEELQRGGDYQYAERVIRSFADTATRDAVATQYERRGYKVTRKVVSCKPVMHAERPVVHAAVSEKTPMGARVQITDGQYAGRVGQYRGPVDANGFTVRVQLSGVGEVQVDSTAVQEL